jgi:hypothetical protein
MIVRKIKERVMARAHVFIALCLLVFPVTGATGGNDETGIIPGGTNGTDSTRMLLQNYPNPFKEFTVFQFYMPMQGRVIISIFDTRGKQFITIFDQEISQGPYTLRWGIRGLGSGVYYYRLTTPKASAIRKMTLLN